MPALSTEEANRHLAALPLWKIVSGELIKTFQFKDFLAALAFVSWQKRPAITRISTFGTTMFGWV
jgi:pterin-4a-carbinolamine dehydratase